MTDRETKKKGNFSRRIYPNWAYRALKADNLFIEIGRNQIKHRHGNIEVCCTTPDQEERLVVLLGNGISKETKQSASC